MKTLLSLLLAAFLVAGIVRLLRDGGANGQPGTEASQSGVSGSQGGAAAGSPRTSGAASGRPGPQGEPLAAGARQWRLRMMRLADGGVLVQGGYFDMPIEEAMRGKQHYVNPLSIRPDEKGSKLTPYEKSFRPMLLAYFVGLPHDIIDGRRWEGWAIPDGVKTIKDPGEEPFTVSAFRVVPAPGTQEPSGSWMWKKR